ncbi:MAG: hypothetical protein ACREBS_08855, partial [Nitrososphaerales archaeon]
MSKIEDSTQSQQPPQKLNVQISMGDAKAEFSGSPEIVLHSVNSFISKQIPELDLAKRLSMNFSTKDLVDR